MYMYKRFIRKSFLMLTLGRIQWCYILQKLPFQYLFFFIHHLQMLQLCIEKKSTSTKLFFEKSFG